MVFRLIIFRFRLGPWLVGLLIFTGYWGLPAVLAAFSGTLVTRESIAALMADLPAPLLQLGVHQALLDAQKLQTGLAYLNDSSHFVFAALLSLGGAAAALILARIHSTVGALSADGILSDDSLTLKTYRRFHGAANHWFARVASLVLAGLTGVLFVSFHFAEAYSYWWGHHQHGLAGYLFAVITAGMVYFGTQTMVLTSFGSVMFAGLLRNPVSFRPFHPDGANGLAPLGRLIMLFWILAVVLGAEICVTLFLGYLGIERLPLVWVLAVAGMTATPALAIVPLYASLRTVHRARAAEVGHFEPLLNTMLARARKLVIEKRYEEAAVALSTLGDMQGVHEALTTLNVWPFNPRALAFVLAIYAVQLVLTLREVLGY